MPGLSFDSYLAISFEGQMSYNGGGTCSRKCEATGFWNVLYSEVALLSLDFDSLWGPLFQCWELPRALNWLGLLLLAFIIIIAILLFNPFNSLW